MGKVRHLDATRLWIQKIDAKQRPQYETIFGTPEPADMMTTEVAQNDIEKHVEFIVVCNFERRVHGASNVATDEARMNLQQIGRPDDWIVGDVGGAGQRIGISRVERAQAASSNAV